MDMETLHSDLRNRLSVLGFNHPLPLGAIGIVSAILDDLIKTSEKLKSSKQHINQLLQEKAAWELGVEPYKCDNSRLLAECNDLHLELVRQRDKFVLANTELKCRVRNLQTEKKQLDERCLQAEAKIRELQSADSKSKKDGVNMQRKPFVSTVRPGYYQPPKCCDSQQRESKCHCPCNQPRKTDILHEIERLQTETQNQTDVIEAYKKQIDYRDREIHRLGALFAGGRPAAALAKDCCYRSVNSLAEDVGKLQEEKVSMQNKLSEVLDSQQSASKKIQKLAERNKNLEQELKEIENVALNVESEANMNILDKDRQNSDLRIKLQQSNMRIKELETILDVKNYGLTSISSSASACSSDSTLQNALRQASEEKRALYKQLNELKQREQTFLGDYEKIKTKYSKLKLKLSNQITSAPESNQDSLELAALRQKHTLLEELLKGVTTERDQLRSELKGLRESIIKLKSDSVDKDLRLAQLESEICLQKKSSVACAASTARVRTADSAISSQNSLSVQSAFHRVERERDSARREVQQLETERDSLRNKLKLATKSQIDEQAKHEETIISYSGQIAKLEAEKRDLLCGQSSSQTSLHMLREENHELQERLKDLESNFSKLRVTHSQLKILQEQTERALSQHQNRLLCSENQLGNAEAKLNQFDGTIDSAHKDMGKLRGDISVLKASNASLQREKDKLLMELDKKTEKLYTVETALNNLKSGKAGMRDTIDRLQKKLENASVDNIHKESTLRNVATETDTLKKQVASLKRSQDNATAENGRLSNELSDAASELTLTKRKLSDCQQEVERMKSQLREYVQEIQRAEELLCIKEREREEMLDHYKSLSEGVNMLEVSNHTLETESAEAKKLLQDAEGRINGLQEKVGLRETEIKTYEQQINGLSANIVSLEAEIECLKEENHNLQEDLEATKDLCSKLDLQKDKLNAELNEHSNIREQLNRENATLKRQLSLSKTGDKAAVDGLQELLAASRSEVEQQRIVTSQLQQEVKFLKDQVENLIKKLDEEHGNAARNEALANEYSVQLQELRRMITDDRFAQVQSREEEDYNRIKNYLNSMGGALKSTSPMKQDCAASMSEANESPDSFYLTGKSDSIVPKSEPASMVSSFSEAFPNDSDELSANEPKKTYGLESNIPSGKYQSYKYDDFFTEGQKDPLELVQRSDNHEKVASEGNGANALYANLLFEGSNMTASEGRTKNSTPHLSKQEQTSTEDRNTQITEDQSEAPAGWKITRYKSLGRSSSSSHQSSSSKKKQPEAGKENAKTTSKLSLSRSNKISVSYGAQKSQSHEEKNIQTNSAKNSSITLDSSYSVVRGKSGSMNQNSFVPEIDISHKQVITGVTPRSFNKKQSSLNTGSTDLVKESEAPLPNLLDVRESEFEKFRRNFFRNNSEAKSTSSHLDSTIERELSLPPLPNVSNMFSETGKQVDSNQNEKGKTEAECSTTATDGKIDEKGSTVVIYKNALGERLILAEDDHHPQEENNRDYTTARDTSSIMVIDDLRRFKTPIRTPKASGGKASTLSSKSQRSGKHRAALAGTAGSSNESSIGTSSKCEQRKWREILQNHKSSHRQKGGRLAPLLSGTTNDRITTINYEILDTRKTSLSAVKAAELQNDSDKKPSLMQPTTVCAGVGGVTNPTTVMVKCDPKTYVLNFKIKVPADPKGKEQKVNFGVKK